MSLPPVIEGIELSGQVNVAPEIIAAQVRHAIRQGHPQLRKQPPCADLVALLGSGPSLNQTLDELLDVLHRGAKLVTCNGAYHWALERHLQPKTQVVLDARASTARFLEPAVPGCNYLIASQCHPDVWDVVKDRERVYIFHATTRGENDLSAILDRFYDGRWESVPGGVTVVTRALMALRLMGYLRYEIFGLDSCFLDGAHHALDQPENASERGYEIVVAPTDRPDLRRAFRCAPWHVQQFSDVLQMIKHGPQWLLNVHGDGLIAHAMRVQAREDDVTVEEVSHGRECMDDLQQGQGAHRERDDQPVHDGVSDGAGEERVELRHQDAGELGQCHG